MMNPTRILILILCCLLAACAPAVPPEDPGLRAVTLRPDQPTDPPSLPAATIPFDLVTVTPAESYCSQDEVARILTHMPAYEPGSGSFVGLDDRGFVLDGERFVVRGINYYPAEHPWQRFPGTDVNIIEADFARLREANINAVRLFLWYEPFFLCPGSGAVPNPRTFLWLDSVIRLASAYGFRVILVLHDLPDLHTAPMYSEAGDTVAQTAFIVNRYKNEPALLAWDLRDAGDADYTPFSDEPAPFTRAQVLDWLARTAAAVRQLDSNHPITAGWVGDSEGTISAVDFVSFQHTGDVHSLRERIAALRGYTQKPLLLIALGINTQEVSEIEQSQRLRESVRAAESDEVAGWLVWTMYDFPVDVTCYPEPCASFDDARHHFGLWRADGSRKPAANTLETLAEQNY